MTFHIDEILREIKGKLLTDGGRRVFTGVSIDSRQIKDGQIFIAIKGKNYDGHDFVRQAIKGGAACAIVQGEKAKKVLGATGHPRRCIISAADTVMALGHLAALHRRGFDIPSIAVTGSCGKTATKEMIYRAIRSSWRPLKNIGTQNNHIGVPLTILKLNNRHGSIVLELGMNHSGEIQRLSRIAQPNVGVVTNIGPAHLQYLGSLQSVYKAKKELLDYLDSWDTAILNHDDAFLRRYRKKGLRIMRYGITHRSEFQARKARRLRNGWSFEVKGTSYFMPSLAYHDIYNALAAICVGTLFNVKQDCMHRALKDIVPPAQRMEVKTFKGIAFIDDTYNSNPLSLESAIKTLSNIKTKGKKILITGDMLELGGRSRYYHARLGRAIAKSGIDELIAVGQLARYTYLEAVSNGMRQSRFYHSKDEVVPLLREMAKPNDVVLVKGSRAMKMEDIIECFITSSTR